MNTAILTIGDEVLYGQTIDTNSTFLAQQLIEMGHDPTYRETVGDEIEMVEESIVKLTRNYELVISTGGLGPTHDDVTKKAICRAFKRNLVLFDDVLKFIEERYKSRNRDMPAAVQSQALLPQGSRVLKNQWGTAPGIMIEQKGSIFVAFPGVPYEMKNLFTHELKPILPPSEEDSVITFKRLRTSGIVESVMYEKLKDLIASNETVKLAFLPGYMGVDLRLTVKEKPRQEALELISDFKDELRERIGKHIYAEEETSISEVIADMLKERKETLSVAESCTGGLLAKMLTDISGSSDYFERGVVSYSNQAKSDALGVPQSLIEQHGAVSSEVAVAMAQGMINSAKTDYALSITGIAGPTGGTDDKPVGTIWIGLASKDGVVTREFHFATDREINRQRAAAAALNMLRLHLLGELKI